MHLRSRGRRLEEPASTRRASPRLISGPAATATGGVNRKRRAATAAEREPSPTGTVREPSPTSDVREPSLVSDPTSSEEAEVVKCYFHVVKKTTSGPRSSPKIYLRRKKVHLRNMRSRLQAVHSEALQGMLRKVEAVELLIHAGGCSPPTSKELKLLCLIKMHLRLHMSHYHLLHVPRLPHPGLKEMLEAGEEVDVVDDELSLIEQLDISSDTFGYSEDLKHESFKVVSLFGRLSEILKEATACAPRSSGTRIRTQDRRRKNQMIDGKLQYEVLSILQMDKEKVQSIREQLLLEVFEGLEDIRKANSYAPISSSEFYYYRQLRMWITSCLIFIEAKVYVARSSGQVGDWDWISWCCNRHPVLRPCVGLNLSSSVEEVLELKLILKQSIKHFIELWYIISGKSGSGSEGSRYYDLLQTHVTAFGRNSDYTFELVRGESRSQNVELLVHGVLRKITTNNRKEWLQYVLELVSDLKFFKCDNLSIEENSLLIQIGMKLTMFVWLACEDFGATGQRTGGTEEPTAVTHDNQVIGDIYDSCAATYVSHHHYRAPILEAQLEDTIKVLEALKASFLNTPPSNEEFNQCQKILMVLNSRLLKMNLEDAGPLLMMPWVKSSVQSEPQDGLDVETINQVLKGIFYWELAFFRRVQEKFGDMIAKALAGGDTTVSFEDVLLGSTHLTKIKEVVVGMPERKVVDQACVLSTKVHRIISVMFGRLYSANYEMLKWRYSKSLAALEADIISFLEYGFLL